jgi:hypothetical protein
MLQLLAIHPHKHRCTNIIVLFCSPYFRIDLAQFISTVRWACTCFWEDFIILQRIHSRPLLIDFPGIFEAGDLLLKFVFGADIQALAQNRRGNGHSSRAGAERVGTV